MESEPDSEQLSDWEQIQSPTNSSVAVDQEGFLGESSVFLPKNHEDLHVKLGPQDDNQGGPEVTNVQSSSSGGHGPWSLKRLHPGSVLCCSWIPWICRGVRNKAVSRVGLRSFTLTTGAVAALVLVSLLRRRVMLVWRRSLQLYKSKESLLAQIKDKEKRIQQLLLQIAQMNEVLLTRRRVRVLLADRSS